MQRAIDRIAELPGAALGGFSDDAIRFAAAGWPLRAAEELRSALIYRALAHASASVMAAPWPERFAAVMREELGHARLCVAVATRLGATRPTYDASPVRARLAELSEPRKRTATLVLSEVAIGETISMALFRAGRRTTREPLSRAALEWILADEVRHQRLGWSALAVLWPALSSAELDVLQREASRTFAASETQIAVPVLRRLEAGEPFDPAWAELGVLPFATRVDAYYFAIERFVVPRLTRLGLDGARAWAERYRP